MTKILRLTGPLPAIAVLAMLGACAHAPEPLGAATSANLSLQAVDPSPEPSGRGAIAGGTGGRAGLAVEALRKAAAETQGERR